MSRAAARRARALARRPASTPAPGPPAGSWLGPAVAAGLTALVFAPALRNGFVWDDVTNLVDNPSVRGLGWRQLSWMLSTTQLGHYIPVTWLSFAVDHRLWGDAAWGYHLTNVVLHAVVAALFCLVATRLLTRPGEARGPADARSVRVAALVAALVFAVHPLRVESVAWVTERRDVLSALFALLAVLAYLAHARGRPGAYGVALACFVLAALSKSIVVTLPVILLLLDVHPLRRLPLAPWSWPTARRLVAEKLPFLGVALALGVVAVLAAARDGRVLTLRELGPLERLAMAGYGVVFYLRKTLLPLDLAVLYQYRPPISTLLPWSVIGGGLALGLTAWLVCARRRWPGALAGWLGYLVLLAPVSGLLQNGLQTAADRYSYLPSLALAALAGGLVRVLWRRGAGWQRGALAGLALAVVAGLGALTWAQVGRWRDSLTLWTHAIAVAESPEAHHNLGLALGVQGRWEAAAVHHRRALELRENDEGAHYHLGVALAALGRWDEAIPHYRRTLEIRPLVEAHVNLAVALTRLGRWDEAQEQYASALRLRPGDPQVLVNLGAGLARQGRLDEAIARYREALRSRPDLAVAHYNWGRALARLGRWDEAVEQYRHALRIDPRSAAAQSDLGVALAARGRLDEAIEAFRATLEIQPDHGAARQNLEAALVLRQRR